MTQHAETADLKPFAAPNWRIGIVVAQFNQHITTQLHEGALQRAAEYGITADHVDSRFVAGSIEIPLVLQSMARSGKYDVLLAIGCVMRGKTVHFDYVCKFVTEGVLRVQLDESMPIGFGVLMCETEAQAQARSHLGAEHLDAALHQLKTLG